MSRCSACDSEVPSGQRFCGRCGTAVASDSVAPTVTSTPASGRPSSSSVASSAPYDQSRFLPGTMLAGRYRIAGLLGRGGMGEVYRADDLKLGQAVALKFLPESFEKDEGRLARFLGEVRTARQVTHSNVCRVYDVGEVDGHHYISMEYVDGEDLATLLRRIGRLPRDKAVQIARQLCAGLAAAHEQGVLHRDLKPANIMIDGRGRARITDFGLAGLAESFGGEEVRAGTPSYMAPEQLAGKGVSVRSDIYSLGLVLYELFTGKPAFDAKSQAELVRMHETSTPATPSSHVEGFDPAVERVILRCLEKDPAQRPGSALAVAAALPGGDPLAAALAAGETPSPQMVADAGGEGTLRPAVAVTCLAVILFGIAMAFFPPRGSRLLDHVGMDKPPQVLADRAREIAAQAGYADPPADSAHGFSVDNEYLRQIRDNDSSPGRWDVLSAGQPPVITYWYRESPRLLVADRPGGIVSWRWPPRLVSGMVNMELDMKGRLDSFYAVPPQVDESEEDPPAPDWAALFTAARLDPGAFDPARPSWLPEDHADSRAAWTGVYPDNPDVPIRVEAAAYRGHPVFFEIIEPWTRPARMESRPQTRGEKLASYAGMVLWLSVLGGALFLARWNLRLGRGDRKGANKVALYAVLVIMASWVFSASHVPDEDEFLLFFLSLAIALLFGGLFWLGYTALEPFLRRWWPGTIVSWNRLLAGRFRDPLVGRDILFGGLFAVGLGLVNRLGWYLTLWLGRPTEQPSGVNFSALLGGRRLAGELLGEQLVVLIPIAFLFLLMLLRVVLRSLWLAIPAFISIFMFFGLVQSENLVIDAVVGIVSLSLIVTVLVRFGLLASAATFLISDLTSDFPITSDPNAWYFGSGLVVALLAVALAGYGFVVSLGGRSLFRPETLQG